MNTTPAPATPKLGPGEYRPDRAFTCAADLPAPKILKAERLFTQLACPHCGKPAARHKVFTRLLHDLGDLASGRPHDLRLFYSQHHCAPCAKYFNAACSDLAPPGGQYTHRVMTLAVRLVVEDGLPYRSASWQLWRDHRVFVPFATIQNWVEAGGKKGGRTLGKRLSRLGVG
jgi:hypothetical protein